jgi:hypothetical protein
VGAVAVLVGIAVVYAATRLTARERRGASLALGIGGAALLIPLLLDLAGFHYLISKNLMPALPVLMVGAAVILGSDRAGAAGVAGAGVACAFFLAITIDGAVDPALQRPDYAAAVAALGAPVRGQVVVTPNLGNAPVELYRPGAVPARAGSPANEVLLVLPRPRADTASARPGTPAPPPGFALRGRLDARTYTLICFGSTLPRPVSTGPLLALGGTAGAAALAWPRAVSSAGNATISRLCGGAG